MQANRPRDTALEVAVRSKLHRSGLRFRKHRRPLEGLRCEADVVFPTERLAIFVDGCFWHGCPIHATRPATNQEWWARKLDRNMERDRDNTRLLRESGWAVLRLWEHEDLASAARKVRAALSELKKASSAKHRADA